MQDEVAGALPVLVDEKHVEPVILRDFASFGHEHLDAVGAQLVVHAHVPHVADAVHGKVRRALAEKDGTNLDAVVFSLVRLIRGKVHLAKVVEHARDGKHVEGAQRSFLQVVSVLAASWRRRGSRRTGPVPWGSSWFPWMEKTGMAMFKLGSS